MEKDLNNTDVNSTEVDNTGVENTGETETTEPKIEKTGETIEMDVAVLKQWFATPEGKQLLQPLLDKHFTKGLGTWKENNLNSVIEAEILKRNPVDPDKVKIKELTEEIKQREIKELAISTLAQKGMDTSLAEFFTQVQDIEVVKQGLDKFSQAWDESMKKAINQRLREIGGTPVNGNLPSHNRLTKKDLLDMPYDQRQTFYSRNPDEFQRIMRG